MPPSNTPHRARSRGGAFLGRGFLSLGFAAAGLGVGLALAAQVITDGAFGNAEGLGNLGVRLSLVIQDL
jgi:hypothetical protein